MLYLTTRDHKEVFTAARTLQQPINDAQCPYVPFRFPTYNANEITELADKPFGKCIADLLNLFFSTQLTGWDIDFAIGRTPVKVISLDKRTFIAEAWHNPQSNFSYAIDNLYSKIRSADSAAKPTEWALIAIHIATLFATYGELVRANAIDPSQSFDIAIATDDLSMLISAMYARKIGLPINAIIAGCSDNQPVWEFVMRGFIRTKNPNYFAGLERLVHALLGQSEACKYANALSKGTLYAVDEEQLSALQKNLFVAVVGKSRIDSTAGRMLTTNSYRTNPQTALAYSALQDYRSKTGESRPALLISHISVK